MNLNVITNKPINNFINNPNTTEKREFRPGSKRNISKLFDEATEIKENDSVSKKRKLSLSDNHPYFNVKKEIVFSDHNIPLNDFSLFDIDHEISPLTPPNTCFNKPPQSPRKHTNSNIQKTEYKLNEIGKSHIYNETNFKTQNEENKEVIINNNPMPLPDFSFINENITFTNTLTTPETPCKIVQLTPVQKKYNRINKKRSIKYNGKNFQLKIINDAKGHYKQAFEIVSKNSIINNIENSNLLIKGFLEIRIRKSCDTKLEGFVKNSIAQYKKVKEAGLLVANIYNIDTILKDKYFIVKKIPKKIELSFPIERQFENLDKQTEDIILSVKKFFNFVVEKKVSLDLLPQNFHLNEENEPILIDLREVEDESDLIVLLVKDLLNWSGKNLTILKKLTEDFVSLDCALANEIEEKLQMELPNFSINRFLNKSEHSQSVQL